MPETKATSLVRRDGLTLYQLTIHADETGEWATLDSCALNPDRTAIEDEDGNPDWRQVDVPSLHEAELARILRLFDYD